MFPLKYQWNCVSLVGGCTQLDCNVGTDRRMIDSSQTRSTDENTKNMLMRWKQNFLIKQTLDSWQFSAQFLLDPVSNNWQLKCLWNPVPMVAPPWPTQTPPIYSLNPSPLSQNMGRTQQVPSPPLVCNMVFKCKGSRRFNMLNLI